MSIVTHKTCCRCKQQLHISAFARQPDSPDGHTYRCRSCTASYRGELRFRNAYRQFTARYGDAITEEAYTTLRETPCSVCGTQQGMSAIVRLDAAAGWTADNVEPRCFRHGS